MSWGWYERISLFLSRQRAGAHLEAHSLQELQSLVGFSQAPKLVQCLNPFVFSSPHKSQLISIISHLTTSPSHCWPMPNRGRGSQSWGSQPSRHRPAFCLTPPLHNWRGKQQSRAVWGFFIHFHPSHLIAAMKGRWQSTKPL